MTNAHQSKINPSRPSSATIDTDKSCTVSFAPGIKLEVSYTNLSPTNPTLINITVGSQQLQPLSLQPGETQSQAYDIAQFSSITFTNQAALKNTPVNIFATQQIVLTQES